MSDPRQPIIPSAINPRGAQPTDPQKLGETRRNVVEQIEWLERLTANPDFQRYIDFMKQGVDSTRKAAEDIERHDAAKRDAFAQRHFGLVAMSKWPAENLASLRENLKALDEQQRKV